ncbi:MAG TPA: hypothetical protein DEP84_07630 [Chloroflexi bacterium]|nr:hypothetical protein [Chloroflexota bacterium]
MNANRRTKLPTTLIRRLMLWAFDRLYNEAAWAYDLAAVVAGGVYWYEWGRAVLPFVAAAPVVEVGTGRGRLLVALAAAGLALLLALFLLLRRRRLLSVLSLIATFAIVAGVMILRQPAQAVEVTGDNANCLFCHANASYSYTFADSSALNLRVNYEHMAESVHTSAEGEPFGCLDCHSADIFPHQSVSFASRGAYRVEMSGVCINCHLEDTAHYEDVLERNILVGCSDCHTAHYVMPANQLNTAVLFRP